MRFFRYTVAANYVTLAPAVALLTFYYLLVVPLFVVFGDIHSHAAQSTGRFFGLLTLPFVLASAPVILLNVIALPIVITKQKLDAQDQLKYKIIVYGSIGILVAPWVLALLMALINPQ